MVRWTELLLRGSEEQITRFLARIDERLTNGWRRDFDAETRAKERQPASITRSYACQGTRNRPAAFVLMWRLGPNQVMVPQVGPLEQGQWTDEKREQAMSSFAADCVRPVATECDLEVEIRVRSQSVFDGLSSGAGALLRAFSDASNKHTPTEADTRRWKEFLLRVWLDNSVVDRDFLDVWLAQQGWPPEQRTRLLGEFTLAMDLLAAYDEECKRRCPH